MSENATSGKRKDVNRVELYGTITSEVKLRLVGEDKCVCSFRLRTTSGQYSTTHKCVIWGSAAKRFVEEATSGDTVGIAGRLKNRKWSKPDGTEEWVTEVVASEVDTSDVLAPDGQDEQDQEANGQAADVVPF